MCWLFNSRSQFRTLAGVGTLENKAFLFSVMEELYPLQSCTAIVTSDVGVSGAKTYTQTHPDGTVEARMAIAIFGNFNMPEEELAKIDYNPFHPDFNDNYAKGVGSTEQEAIAEMRKDVSDIADSLWF